jgi:hypothetical protein
MIKASSDSESDSDSDSSETETTSEDDDEVPADSNDQALLQQLIQQQQLQQLQGLGQPRLQNYLPPPTLQVGRSAAARSPAGRAAQMQRARALGLDPKALKKAKKEKKKKKRASKLEFKRVDQLWDSTIHNYKLTDTAEDEESSEYDQYLFNVRRTFDWEGKYKVSLVNNTALPVLIRLDYCG